MVDQTARGEESLRNGVTRLPDFAASAAIPDNADTVRRPLSGSEIDLNALIELAESLDASAELHMYPLGMGGGVSKIEREVADLDRHIANRIREALGVVE